MNETKRPTTESESDAAAAPASPSPANGRPAPPGRAPARPGCPAGRGAAVAAGERKLYGSGPARPGLAPLARFIHKLRSAPGRKLY